MMVLSLVSCDDADHAMMVLSLVSCDDADHAMMVLSLVSCDDADHAMMVLSLVSCDDADHAMMPFMSPRYPGGPRVPVRMPNEFNGPPGSAPGQIPMPNSMEPRPASFVAHGWSHHHRQPSTPSRMKSSSWPAINSITDGVIIIASQLSFAMVLPYSQLRSSCGS
ncbi:hypothetical protein ACOMHN_022473 [Nucella lapillus]